MKKHSNLLDDGKIILSECDGRKGLGEHHPFDIINVGGSTNKIPRDLM